MPGSPGYDAAVGAPTPLFAFERQAPWFLQGVLQELSVAFFAKCVAGGPSSALLGWQHGIEVPGKPAFQGVLQFLLLLAGDSVETHATLARSVGPDDGPD